MVTFGETVHTTNLLGIHDRIRGSWYVCPVKGTARSISAYLQLDNTLELNTTEFKYKYAIYNYNGAGDAGAFVGSTKEGAVKVRSGTSITGWFSLDFVAPFKDLSANTNYFLVAFGYRNTANARFKIDQNALFPQAGKGVNLSTLYSGGFPDPLTGETSTTAPHTIVCTVRQDTRPGFNYVCWTP